MTGQCLLIGFNKVNVVKKKYESWATVHLSSNDTPTPIGQESCSEWTKRNFTTVSENVPEPTGQSTEYLESWAKENFVTTE